MHLYARQRYWRHYLNYSTVFIYLIMYERNINSKKKFNLFVYIQRKVDPEIKICEVNKEKRD